MDEITVPSPIEFIKRTANKIDVFVKREDLIHRQFGGNKWRKLKFNIAKFQDNNYDILVTFGGAFSNHIAATASICKYYNIPSVGLIRGTFVDDKNPTLHKAISDGMHIHHIPKVEYKLKQESQFVQELIANYTNPYIVPEGGSNLLAKEGLKEMVEEIKDENFDHIFVAAGTGMTAAGIIDAVESSTKIWIVNVLKNPELDDTIRSNLSTVNDNWEVLHDYHCGGYAKVTNDLQEFANNFFDLYKIILDPIYNAKMMLAADAIIRNNKIHMSQKVLCIHTGGHQGVTGFEYRSGKNWIG